MKQKRNKKRDIISTLILVFGAAVLTIGIIIYLLKNMMENIIMGIEFEPREAILSHKEGVDVLKNNLVGGVSMPSMQQNFQEQEA